MYARLYWTSQKAGLHLDESLSVIISECKEIGYTQKFPENVVYTGAEMRKLSWASSSSFMDAFSDIKQLHVDCKDSPHTNLYYSALRLCLTGADGQLKSIIARGCYLNIFFFLFSFFFLYKLLKRLFDDDLVIATTVLVAFVNTASISSALYIRPYVLQETFFILLTYVFTRIYQTIERNSGKYKWTHIIPLSVLLSFVLLTGYLSLIYVILLLGTLIMLSLIRDQRRMVILLLVSFALSLAFANTFYRKYFDGFLSYRALEGFSMLSYKMLICNLFRSLSKAFEFIAYLLLPFFIICLPFFKKYNLRIERNDQIALIIVICCTLYIISALAVVVYKDFHYVVPAFPLLTLVIPVIFRGTAYDGLKKNMVLASIVSAYIFIAFNSLEQDGYFIKQRIKNLYRDSGKKFPFIAKSNIPVLIYINNDVWRVAEILAFANDNQRYEFVYSYDSLINQLQKYGHVFVYMIGLQINEKKKSRRECPVKMPKEYEMVAQRDFDDKRIVLYELKKHCESRDENNKFK
jgi:hypothetical protein